MYSYKVHISFWEIWYFEYVGTYNDTDGSQFGMLALHQLMRQMPLLQGSKKQVNNRIELNIQVQQCAVYNHL